MELFYAKSGSYGIYVGEDEDQVHVNFKNHIYQAPSKAVSDLMKKHGGYGADGNQFCLEKDKHVIMGNQVASDAVRFKEDEMQAEFDEILQKKESGHASEKAKLEAEIAKLKSGATSKGKK